MKVYCSITIQVDTGEVLHADAYEYFGPVALAKGASKKVRKAAMRTQEEQFNLMKQQLAKVTGGVERFLTPEGEGFDEATLAALRAQAIEGTAEQEQDAQSQLMRALASRGAAGGALPVGGDFLRSLIPLKSNFARIRSGLLRDVTVQNMIQKLQNRFNAANALLGVGAQHTGAATSALGTAASAAQSEDQPGFFGKLGGAFAGTLGTRLGEAAVSGVGRLFGGR